MILNETAKTELSLKYKGPDLKGTIRIGTYDSIALYFFPRFLKYLKFSHPRLSIELITDRSQRFFEELKNDDLDLGVIIEREADSDIPYQTIYSDTFGFYQSGGEERRYFDHLIYFSDTLPSPKLIRVAIKSLGLSNDIRPDNLETVRGLTERGLGIGFLPHRVARDLVLSGILRPVRRKDLGDHYFPHNIKLYRSRKTKSSITHDLIEEELKRYLVSWSETLKASF
ncbi:MAG: hypothetical protein EOP09_02440 [Proteobacteria bacterium]|nr:MAG: hypothetical protein EOP09_02440 [Pseudomonadota bacterium]